MASRVELPEVGLSLRHRPRRPPVRSWVLRSRQPVLVLGRTGGGRPVHVVCAYAPEDDQLVVITVDEPDPNRWNQEFRQRRKP